MENLRSRALEVSARLLAITWRKKTYLINKRGIPATPKIYDIFEVLAARHLYFPKVLAARHLYYFLSARCSREKFDNCSCSQK